MDRQTVLNKASMIETVGCGPDEAAWLYDMASQCESVVEVGCWKGKSTFVLAQACKGQVYAVDHFKGSMSEINDACAEAKEGKIYEIFMKNVSECDNLTVYRDDSILASKHFADKSIDMIYIDADHDYECVLSDFKAWLPKCKKLFTGHDTHFPGVVKALNEMGLKWERGAGSMWKVEL